MLEQQVKGKIKFHTMLSVRQVVSNHNALYFFFILDLEDNKRLLMKKAEQETFKIKEENIKLKDENKGS